MECITCNKYHSGPCGSNEQTGSNDKPLGKKVGEGNDMDVEGPQQTWTIEEVAVWAKKVAGDTTAKIFLDQEVNGQSLFLCTADMLKEWGVKGGPILTIMNSIKLMNEPKQGTLKRQFGEVNYSERQDKYKVVKFENVKLGSVVKINLKFPGLATGNETSLYFRDSAVNLINHLCSNATVLVQGPPGSGKSSMVWYWASHVVENLIVCWVHLGTVVTICSITSTSMHQNKVSVDTVPEFLRNVEADVLVIDGVTQKDISHSTMVSIALAKQFNKQIAKLVIVSSLQYIIKREEKIVENIAQFDMPSWEYEEYVL